MRSRRAAFTLIEVMVVVVILAILAAIFASTYATPGHNSLALDSLNFRGSPGVVVTVSEASNQGWSASVTHPESYPLKCAMFEGTAAPLPPATAESQITCQ